MKYIFIAIVAGYWLFFRIPAIIKKKMKKGEIEVKREKLIGELPLLLSLIYYALACVLAWYTVFEIITFSIGIGLFIFAAAFNEWARCLLGKQWSGAVQILKKHKLIASGPYRFVRHPMYFANILLALGAVIALRNIYMLILMLVFFPPILFYRAKEEEKELEKKFGVEWEKYKKHTPMIIPFTKW